MPLSQGVWHLPGRCGADTGGSIFCWVFGSGAAALPVCCPPGVLWPWYVALSRGSLSQGSLVLLPNVCFQGNAAGTRAGAAVEIWQRTPSARNSGGCGSSLLAPVGAGGSRVQAAPLGSGDGILGISGGGKADVVRSEQTWKYVCYPQPTLKK